MTHVHDYKKGRGNVSTCYCGRFVGHGEPIVAKNIESNIKENNMTTLEAYTEVDGGQTPQLIAEYTEEVQS